MDGLTSSSDLMKLSAPTLPTATGKAAQVKQAAQDFEAVYIGQMLKPMFDTIEVDPVFGGGQAEETWRSMMVDEMGKQVARNGGIGLAPVVEKEMLRLQEVADGAH